MRVRSFLISKVRRSRRQVQQSWELLFLGEKKTARNAAHRRPGMVDRIQIFRYPEIQTSRYPETKISKYIGIQISRRPDIQISRYQVSRDRDLQICRYTDIQISRIPYVQLSKYSDVQTSRYPDIQISGYPDLQKSRHPDIQISIFRSLFQGLPNPAQPVDSQQTDEKQFMRRCHVFQGKNVC